MADDFNFDTPNITIPVGGEYEYTFADGRAFTYFQPLTNNVKVRATSGTAGFTIFANTALGFETRAMMGRTIYLSGTAGTVVEIIYADGLLC
jgi:hypothetical protein